MSLTVHDIQLTNFRSYDSYALNNISPLMVIVGPNAVGKTNLIEAINLITGIASFRNPRTAELVKDEAFPSRIRATIMGDNRELCLEMRVQEGKKTYFLNDKQKRAHELKGIIPSVVFTPDDLLLVKGPDSQRRAALDTLGSQLNPGYPLIRRDFEQILRQKNNALKDGASLPLIESINEVFVTCATQLFCYRFSLFEKLIPYIQDIYNDIAQREERISARYIPSWEQDANVSHETLNAHDKEAVRAKFMQTVESCLFEEYGRRRALIGPQHDKVRFYINDREASSFASQGQQRSLVLAWKLAEVALIEEVLDTRPILLLDDVMSELDQVRRAELTKYVLKSTQTFITTTNIDYFDREMLNRATCVNLEDAKR